METLQYRLMVECTNESSHIPDIEFNKDIEYSFRLLTDYQKLKLFSNFNKLIEHITLVLQDSGIDPIKVEVNMLELDNIPIIQIKYRLDFPDDKDLVKAEQKPLSPEILENFRRTGLPF